ncbi:MAG: HAD hydrolase-like protein [Nostoc sp.]|uniref:HAD hydrolase-like protein n=1 Tax=Nostoc sp. TaxID=1180 RepID=UPI002FFCF927
MRTELVIFDCDGVLVDSETLGNRVLVQFVAEFGLALELEEAILLFKGCKMADCVAVIEQRLEQKLPPDFVTQLRARTAEVFEHELLPVEGIEAALDKINLPICVASSGPLEKIKLALRVTNLLPRFGVQPGYAQIGTCCKVMLRRYLKNLDLTLFQYWIERVLSCKDIP